MTALTVFYFYLPKLIVQSVTTEEGIQVIPQDIKADINETAEQLPKVIESLDLGFTIDDIIMVLDNASTTQIIMTIKELKEEDPQSEKAVLDIIARNIELYKLNNPKARNKFLEKVDMHHIARGMKAIEENGKPYRLTIPIAKETIKGILIEKQKQIEDQLNS